MGSLVMMKMILRQTSLGMVKLQLGITYVKMLRISILKVMRNLQKVTVKKLL